MSFRWRRFVIVAPLQHTIAWPSTTNSWNRKLCLSYKISYLSIQSHLKKNPRRLVFVMSGDVSLLIIVVGGISSIAKVSCSKRWILKDFFTNFTQTLQLKIKNSSTSQIKTKKCQKFSLVRSTPSGLGTHKKMSHHWCTTVYDISFKLSRSVIHFR